MSIAWYSASVNIRVYNHYSPCCCFFQISKSNVVDDMVESNSILYPDGRKPDHCVVIKYVPHVGDSKRAMDEYTSEIMMGGTNTLVIHNTCEDSLLASPLILDLVILGELFERVQYKTEADEGFQNFNCILTLLNYLVKAPLVPKGTPIINSLFRQKSCIENVLRACVGLAPTNHMMLEHKHADIDLPIEREIKTPAPMPTKKPVSVHSSNAYTYVNTTARRSSDEADK